MEKDYSALFERIRQKCRQHNWYGSDGDYDWIIYSKRIEDGLEDDDLKQKLALLRIRFAYPPATKAQLDATEEALGFALPEALRALYAQVANGGFGPGIDGIIGAQSGFPNDDEYPGKDIADVYYNRKRHCRLVDLALYEEQLAAEKGFHLDWEEFPAFFLLLCNIGCGMKIYIDATTSRIFQEYIHSNEYCGISLKANSLEEWLKAWLTEP